MDFETIEDVGGLARLAPEWSDLLARSDTDEATLSPLWLEPWWRLFGDGNRGLRAFAFRDRGRLVGLAPLCSRVHWYRPGIPFRRLELVGSGEDEADEICSDYL